MKSSLKQEIQNISLLSFSLLFNSCVFHIRIVCEKIRWNSSILQRNYAYSRRCIFDIHQHTQLDVIKKNCIWTRWLICRARNNVRIESNTSCENLSRAEGLSTGALGCRGSLFSLLIRGRVRNAARLAGPLIVRYVYRSICVTFLSLYPLFAANSSGCLIERLNNAFLITRFTITPHRTWR